MSEVKKPSASKKPSSLSRLRETKKPASKKTNRFSSKVLAKRRQAYYTTGSGSTGLLVHRNRVVRHIRAIRKIENERVKAITGFSNGDKKQNVIFKTFSQVVVSALDSYANRIMEIASKIASGRSHKEGGGGVKLRVSDLEKAIEIIVKVAYQ
jgi:hypothetical protein